MFFFDYLNLIIAIPACILFCVIGNLHAAYRAGIAAIAYVRIIMHEKHD